VTALGVLRGAGRINARTGPTPPFPRQLSGTLGPYIGRTRTRAADGSAAAIRGAAFVASMTRVSDSSWSSLAVSAYETLYPEAGRDAWQMHALSWGVSKRSCLSGTSRLDRPGL
jgi:hypothetical protein